MCRTTSSVGRRCAPPASRCSTCPRSCAARRSRTDGTKSALSSFMMEATPRRAIDDLSDVPDVVGHLFGAAQRAAGARLELVADNVSAGAAVLGRAASLLLLAVVAALLALVCVSAGAAALLSPSLGWGWSFVVIGGALFALAGVVAHGALRAMAAV